LHWRPVGLWLARQFLDYEPGIHWSQMQMQSGTTGINTTRVYNPIKQAHDHDPHGHFVRRWLPHLRKVPQTWYVRALAHAKGGMACSSEQQ
jgi:deoxyribodipyrimidine photo-lyase